MTSKMSYGGMNVFYNFKLSFEIFEESGQIGWIPSSSRTSLTRYKVYIKR
jgi:hypothetical protein